MNQRIGYRLAVARQPESLADGYKAITQSLADADLSAFRGKAIGLAGIGASFQAAMLGASYLRNRNIRAMAYLPGELLDVGDAAAEAFVALSASGQSREIAEVMQIHAGAPRLAICRSPGTPLEAIAGQGLAYHSGADNGASSTGYTGMVLALGLLGDRFAGWSSSATFAQLGETIGEMMSRLAEPAAQAAALLASRANIDIVGAKGAFATAGEAAMLIREAVRVPAAGWDTLNYLHGPMESQDARTGLIALGDGREVKIAEDVAAFGCPSVLVTRREDVSSTDNLVVLTIPSLDNEIAEAIAHIVAVQLVVGDMQDAAGLTDITFRYRQTDTKLKPWSAAEV